ncbi:MAG: uroporphyrinogen decarboxylase family protein [Phycisphaerae bacterium]
MNHVERFRAVMDFKPVDRLPRIEWATWWDKTLGRWKSEGLPSDLHSTQDILSYFGLDPYCQFWISTTDNAPESAQSPVGGTVTNMDDYTALRSRLFPEPNLEDMAPWDKRQQQGDAVVWITLEGFFWFPRTLLGIERHLYAFYDIPELIHRMNSDLTDYHIRTLKKMSGICRPTFMTFAEDMSYNHGPMLSRELFCEFLAPYYRKIIPLLNELNIIPIVDSDGDVAQMVPWLLDVGVRGILPLERQAGVDSAALRESFPGLGMIGHFDKMVMNKGGDAIQNEFERLLPTMKTGGFIPSVDHQTPPGVSLEQYRSYLRLLNEYTVRAGYFRSTNGI